MPFLCDHACMEFDYTVTTAKDFAAASSSVLEEIAKAGMRVLHVHDLQASLAEKGIHRDPYKIVEFCNAKYSSEFLRADPKIGLCMPCKINVYVHEGKVFLSGMRPIALSQFFPQADLGDKPQEVDAIVRAIIDKAKGA
ncbi:MAG: hypothetical protein PeribacterA2_1112 [Candidatus Peribacter riflensis]|uniref:DUF302 domain-containing protein n=1 Tax=Candidatus Peribacter riflensis TaxID=1735162 RepID=A0A0S1SWP7_9BACT|nr:MAG: hypothetical protein PeribacterA2_1112 [Candidatus Peribacter riflensis]ALM11570.1 MAG: hypothetical protein PeribacterB2_1114 [Candidatus Peribacter riflensis]ALM12672.1 MAG: hypothetical protein PeribacterC2_1113 [Candidatus Peribacter riflensis]ALM13773.1 MAG: hypothetical protein PeribacterD1_1112 [Candidatus Peribacter riflensis]ALM14876.1 MAG: hypothetical protein PeribacterD2_1114 [Candidatus Peribacter riflensis]